MRVLGQVVPAILWLLAGWAASPQSETIRICDQNGCADRDRNYVAAPQPAATSAIRDADTYQGEDPAALQASAAAGSAAAAYKLGEVYGYGLAKNPRDPALEAQYYQIAADRGHPWAEYRLAELYRSGEGVARSNQEFMQLTFAAAKQGQPDAAYNLGLIYFDGVSLPADQTEAARWFSTAAAAGNADAAYNLGLMKMRGQGGERDLYGGLQMMRQAGSGGNLDAQVALGHLYASGLDTMKPDVAEAKTWFTLAAGRGNADAKASLAALEAPPPAQNEKSKPAAQDDQAQASALAVPAMAFLAGALLESFAEPDIVVYGW